MKTVFINDENFIVHRQPILIIHHGAGDFWMLHSNMYATDQLRIYLLSYINPSTIEKLFPMLFLKFLSVSRQQQFNKGRIFQSRVFTAILLPMV